MPLSVGFPVLISNLSDAYTKARDDGIEKDANSDQIISKLADDMSRSIHSYSETAQVITTDSILPGQTASGPFGVGSYVTPGVATGLGNISFKSADVDTLRSDIEAALKKARDAGLQDKANFDSIISNIASDMQSGIHKFMLTAEVKTDLVIVGGVPVIGYLTTTAPPIPLPSLSSPGTGKGSGFLS
tara:strand:+ start:1189 stop:1749 length:561 start_codon:yes stop_codon:yes gene_type:complete